MKKIVLSIIFMFVSISGIFANNINIVDSIKYNINFNTEQLARTLQMTDEQKDRFDYLNEYFEYKNEKNNLEENENIRKIKFKHLIDSFVKSSKYILNDEQWHKYVMLLNLTLKNRNINF